jgi:uncharacterized membrane protein YciS (DUF1049 family)
MEGKIKKNFFHYYSSHNHYKINFILDAFSWVFFGIGFILFTSGIFSCFNFAKNTIKFLRLRNKIKNLEIQIKENSKVSNQLIEPNSFELIRQVDLTKNNPYEVNNTKRANLTQKRVEKYSNLIIKIKKRTPLLINILKKRNKINPIKNNS